MSLIHFSRVNEPLQRSTSKSTSKTTHYESQAIRQGLKKKKGRGERKGDKEPSHDSSAYVFPLNTSHVQ